MNSFSQAGPGATPDFFFRVADRLHMESCIHSLLHEGKSLALYCPESALLEHYAGQLIQKLKNLAPQAPMEVFFPANSEALVNRFNDVLSHLSIDVATLAPSASSATAPEKIWVVHDAHALPANELQLLTRLLQQFPGAKVGAILMVSGKTNPLMSVDTPNRRIVRWDMALPSEEQAQQALLQAQAEGRGPVVQQLIQRLHLGQTVPTAGAATSAGARFEIEPAVRHWEEDDEATAPERKPGRFWTWLGSLLLLLVLSVGVTAWLQPKAFGQLANQALDWMFPKGRTSPEPVATPTPPPAPTEPTPPTGPSAMPPATATATDASATPGSASAPAATGTTESALPPAPAAGAAPSAPVLSAPAEKVVEKKAPEVVTELPDIAIRGQQWLAGLPQDSFVINHGQFASTQEAQKLIKSQSWLSQARLLPIYSGQNDQAQFMVATGPFRTEDRAKAFMARLGIPASASRVLVSQLLPSTRNGEEKVTKPTKAKKP